MDTTALYGFLGSVAATIVWVAIGTVLLFLGYRLFDRLDPIDYLAEIKGGNVAAAVVIAAYLLGLAYIIGIVIRSP